MAKTQNRFEVVYKQGTWEVVKILRDNETGVQYLIHQEGYGAGMTPLIDPEGELVIDKNVKAEK